MFAYITIIISFYVSIWWSRVLDFHVCSTNKSGSRNVNSGDTVQ